MLYAWKDGGKGFKSRTTATIRLQYLRAGFDSARKAVRVLPFELRSARRFPKCGDVAWWWAICTRNGLRSPLPSLRHRVVSRRAGFGGGTGVRASQIPLQDREAPSEPWSLVCKDSARTSGNS